MVWHSREDTLLKVVVFEELAVREAPMAASRWFQIGPVERWLGDSSGERRRNSSHDGCPDLGEAEAGSDTALKNFGTELEEATTGSGGRAVRPCGSAARRRISAEQRCSGQGGGQSLGLGFRIGVL